MEGLAKVQKACQMIFMHKDVIELARVINRPENQVKLAVGESIFEGFDPMIDLAYLTAHEGDIYGPGSRYRQGHEELFYDQGYRFAQVAPPQRLVGPTNSADKEESHEEQVSTVPDNELFIDNDILMGEKDEAGTDRVTRREDKLLAARPIRSPSTSTSRPEAGNFNSRNKSINAANLQATLDSGASSNLSLLPSNNIENEDNSSSSASSKQTPYTPSYTSINNAKKKKDNGKEFMRTKVKYFDEWLKRMKRAPLPKRPRGDDGDYAISPFKHKSAAVKALTAADYRSLIAFVETKEKALSAVEQTDPPTRNQPINTKKRGGEELGGEDDYNYSDEQSDAASSPQKTLHIQPKIERIAKFC